MNKVEEGGGGERLLKQKTGNKRHVAPSCEMNGHSPNPQLAAKQTEVRSEGAAKERK